MIAMPVAPRSEDGSSRSRWVRGTRALLAGLVAASAMFFLIATIQTPGLDPPPESAALFLVVTTAGLTSYELLRSGDALGYLGAMLTGGLVIVILGIILAGTYGDAGPRTNPIGPLSYVLLAIGVIITAGMAWRRDPAISSS